MQDLGLHLSIVTGHDNLGRSVLNSLGEVKGTRDIGGPQEHLGAVVAVETGVASTLLLGENVGRDQELGVGACSTGADHDHSAANLLALDTTEEDTTVVTSLCRFKLLLEGLDTGNNSLDRVLVEADELDFLTLLKLATLNTSGSDSSTSSNRKDIFPVTLA